MPEYKDTIICWLNENKETHKKFLVIKDLETEKTTFVNMHKFWEEALSELTRLPNVPMFTASVRVDKPDNLQAAREALITKSEAAPTAEQVADDVPF